MSREEVVRKLQTARRYMKMAQCCRKCLEEDGCFDRGYVVDVNEQYVMLHIVDDRVELDGYTVLRIDDISNVVCDFENYRFIEKALAIRKQEPERPALVDIKDMETMLSSIDESFPLMVLHREEMSDDQCWVGELETINDKTFTIREIDPDAKWGGSKRIKFEEVTRIEFDGGYETALAQVAGIR